MHHTLKTFGLKESLTLLYIVHVYNYIHTVVNSCCTTKMNHENTL